jgi:hypothetical protein
VSKISAANPGEEQEALVDADLDTLATALYVRIDDLLKGSPEWAPWRPKVGIAPKITDAELITLAVMQALLGHTSEARWLRYTRVHLRHLFRYLPQQPGYNKRLRRLGTTIGWLVGVLARDTTLWTDDVWVADSTPVECARSRDAVQRSDLAGWAEYGYCASHSRFFWGFRLYLIAAPDGMPIIWGLANPKIGEREVTRALLEHDHHLIRTGQVILGDKGFAGREFETFIHDELGAHLLRPDRRNETTRHGELSRARQWIEAIFDTLKGQLTLEHHAGRTLPGVYARVAARLLALAAAIWHNWKTNAPIKRSLIAYDH